MRVGLLIVLLSTTTAACGSDEPVFVSVFAPNDTYDTLGPYRVEARVKSPNGVFRLLLRLQQEEGSAAFTDVPFEVIDDRIDGGEYFVELPGRPAGTVFAYYLLLVDGKKEGGGQLVTEPPAPPDDLRSCDRGLYCFEILER